MTTEMNPVTHDSDDWRRVQYRLQTLEGDVSEVKSDIGVLKERQSQQHAQNRQDISDLKLIIKGDGSEDNIGMDKKLDRIYTIVKVIAWLVGPGIVLTVGLEVSRAGR